MATVAILSLIPNTNLPEAPLIPHLDKLVHFLFYAIFASLVVFSFPGKNHLKKFALILLGTVAFSLFIEILQALLPFGRSFSLLDLLANVLGALSGIISTNCLIRLMLPRI